MRRNVLVTTRLFDDATVDWLQSQDCRVLRSGLAPDQLDTALPSARIDDLLAEADGWIVGMIPVTRALLSRHPALQVIARRGVGYDTVDAVAAADLGRVVTIAAGGNEPSVADHALAMMLALAKRLRDSSERMARGDWTVLSGGDLFGRTVGLIGFGRIARMVARRLAGFETRILAFSPNIDRDAARSLGVEAVDLPTLLGQSDFISLHLPLTAATADIIDAGAIDAMKPGAIIVNTARGGLIDEAALADALERGRLGGAGLDVFAAEGDPALRPLADRLIRLPNVVATAHAAGSSREGLVRANRIAAETVVAVLNGGNPAAPCVVADGRSGPRGDG